jgi:hypothetical protein
MLFFFFSRSGTKIHANDEEEQARQRSFYTYYYMENEQLTG